MPRRMIPIQGHLNPYRNINRPDPILDGGAHLAASIMDGNRQRTALEDQGRRERAAAAVAAAKDKTNRDHLERTDARQTMNDWFAGQDRQATAGYRDEQRAWRQQDATARAEAQKSRDAHQWLGDQRRQEHQDQVDLQGRVKASHENFDRTASLMDPTYGKPGGKAVDPGDHSLKTYQHAMDVARQQHGSSQKDPHVIKATADAIYDRLQREPNSGLLEREPDHNGDGVPDAAEPADGPPGVDAAARPTAYNDLFDNGAMGPGVAPTRYDDSRVPPAPSTMDNVAADMADPQAWKDGADEAGSWFPGGADPNADTGPSDPGQDWVGGDSVDPAEAQPRFTPQESQFILGTLSKQNPQARASLEKVFASGDPAKITEARRRLRVMMQPAGSSAPAEPAMAARGP